MLCTKWPTKHVSHDSRATFHLVTLFDLTLTLTLFYYKVHAYMLPFSSLGKSLGKVWVAAVFTPVSVADKAKSDNFGF